MCAARNTALGRRPAAATSPSSTPTTSWRPDFLRLAVAAMHGQGLRAAYAGMAYDDEDGVRRLRAFPGTLEDLLVINHVDLNVLVVETGLVREVGGFDTSLRRWVDHDYAIRLAQHADLHAAAVHRPRLRALDGPLPDRITTTESDAWQFVVLQKHWVRWDEVAGPRRSGSPAGCR